MPAILRLVGEELSKIKGRQIEVRRVEEGADLTLVSYISGSADRLNWDSVKETAKHAKESVRGGTAKNMVIAIIRRHEALRTWPTKLSDTSYGTQASEKADVSFVDLIYSANKGGFDLSTHEHGGVFMGFNQVGIVKIAQLCAAMIN